MGRVDKQTNNSEMVYNTWGDKLDQENPEDPIDENEGPVDLSVDLENIGDDEAALLNDVERDVGRDALGSHSVGGNHEKQQDVGREAVGSNSVDGNHANGNFVCEDFVVRPADEAGNGQLYYSEKIMSPLEIEQLEEVLMAGRGEMERSVFNRFMEITMPHRISRLRELGGRSPEAIKYVLWIFGNYSTVSVKQWKI